MIQMKIIYGDISMKDPWQNRKALLHLNVMNKKNLASDEELVIVLLENVHVQTRPFQEIFATKSKTLSFQNVPQMKYLAMDLEDVV